MNHLQKFRKQFLLSPKADLRPVKVAVQSIGDVNDIASEFIANIDNKTEKEGFVVHSQLNILGRIFKQTQGMLVCIASNCPTSGEALARVVVEGSVNLMYITSKGDEATLVGFLESWLIEHKRKLNEWKQKMVGSEHENYVTPMIDSRLKLISSYELFLNQIVSKCNIERKPPRDVWPKSLFNRFLEIGRETDYYESYHRLSGSSHITGEDTLSWLLSLNMDDKARYNIGKEAVAYSIMMSRISSLFFIDAAISCCDAHGFTELNKFDQPRSNLVKSVFEITDEAGVPK